MPQLKFKVLTNSECEGLKKALTTLKESIAEEESTHQTKATQMDRETKIAMGVKGIQKALQSYLRRPYSAQPPLFRPVGWSPKEQRFVHELARETRMLELDPSRDLEKLRHILVYINKHIDRQPDPDALKRPDIWKPTDRDQRGHPREMEHAARQLDQHHEAPQETVAESMMFDNNERFRELREAMHKKYARVPPTPEERQRELDNIAARAAGIEYQINTAQAYGEDGEGDDVDDRRQSEEEEVCGDMGEQFIKAEEE